MAGPVALRPPCARQVLSLEQRRRQRQMQRIRAVYAFLTDDEIADAMADCDQDESLVLSRIALDGAAYVHELRRRIAQAHDPAAGTIRTGIVPKRRVVQAKRLPLNQALQQLSEAASPAEAMRDWSAARIRAYAALETNPNAYYYRFNAPGEAQRTGPWSADEKALFLRRVAEIGVDGRWGLFAAAIPGRVGYQCANFYRLLVRTGELRDDNYTVDAGGRVHRQRQQRLSSSSSSTAFAPGPAAELLPRPKRRRCRRRRRGDRRRRSTSDEDSDAADRGGSRADAAAGDDGAAVAAHPRACADRWLRCGNAVRRPHRRPRRCRIGRRIVVVVACLAPAELLLHHEAHAASAGRAGAGRGAACGQPAAGHAGSDHAAGRCCANHLAVRACDEVRRPQSPRPLTPVRARACVPPSPTLTLVRGRRGGHDTRGDSYASWMRCLERRRMCPFTGKPLRREDLVVLTRDNVALYRDRIVNYNAAGGAGDV